MSKYFYIIFNPKDPRKEYRGIIDGSNMEVVASYFFKRGYVIRELKTASQDDIYIDRLKKYRNKLSGKDDKLPQIPQEQKSRSRLAWAIVLLIMFIHLLIPIIYLLWRGT